MIDHLVREWVRRRRAEQQVPGGFQSVAVVAAALKSTGGVERADRLGIADAIPLTGEHLGLSPFLPAYVRRDVDEELRHCLAAATGGRAFLLLVGQSGAGKTRTAFETVAETLPEWRFVRPSDGESLNRLVDDKADLSRTVIWLDELQAFLRGATPLTAHTVRHLLAPSSAPTVLIGTMWPVNYETLAAQPDDGVHDLNANARDVLRMVTKRVDMSTRFSAEEMRRVAAKGGDPRLAEAVASAMDDCVTLELAAVPQLIRKWRSGIDQQLGANTYGAAMLTAAVTIRRCGHPPLIPPDLLTAMAKTLLSGHQRAVAPADWQARAVAWACHPVRGDSAPLTADGQDIGAVEGYRVHDALVQDAASNPAGPAGKVDESAWILVSELASPEACFDVGVVAYDTGQLPAALVASRRAADFGNTSAMYNLGLQLYKAGDQDLARQWWQRSADLGNVGAMYNLGILLVQAEDTERAQRWLKRAAEMGHARAMNYIGLQAKQSGDGRQAQKWWQRSADLGNDDAMFHLGTLRYEAGDAGQAEHWLRQGAELGHTGAMTNLGAVLKEKGDLPQAHRWYRQAADLGNADAMFNLGCLLAEAKNGDKAQRWYTRAAAVGHTRAMVNQGWLLYEAGDAEQAQQWLQRAASLGDADAMFNLGSLVGDLGDMRRALRWYRQAAELGHVNAMSNLGALLSEQNVTEEAEQWLLRAASHDHAAAMNNLGALYYEKDDLERAEHWLKRAAALGHVGAADNLEILTLETADGHDG
ncbi:tetratricopeptide repeat protein [Catellatospora citrea]|uniref:tetratricopeptide repeat protein n=1 Tax=Catellatospora citrea TaxID=53366 RepID=UPI0033D0D74A